MTSPGSRRTVEGTGHRIQYFDYLRVLATAGIVLLHSASTVVLHERNGRLGMFSDFNIANAYDSIGRFGVDVFLMISGALMLDPQHRFRLVRQAKRVAIPLLVWSAIYVIFNKIANETGAPMIAGSSEIGYQFDLSSAPVKVLTGAVAGHLWFVYMLLGIYLVVPLLRPITALAEPGRRRLLTYLMALWLVLDLVVNTIGQVWPDSPRIYALVLPQFPAEFLGIFILGYVLHHYDIRIDRRLLMLGTFLGFACIAGITYGQVAYGRGSLWSYDDVLLPVVFFAASVFLLAKGAVPRSDEVPKPIALGSHLSFRVYLLHLLVLHLLSVVSPLHGWYIANPFFSIPALALLTLVISFTLAWLIDQIKPIRAYV